MTVEPQLVPVLREGIDVIKMVLYRELKSLLLSGNRNPAYVSKLTGAVVNELFGAIQTETLMESFGPANQSAVQKTLGMISTELDHLKIPLTDALRIQFLCDSHEGINSAAVLEKAQQLDILILEREAPLPGAFMNIVRSFGRAYGILDPQPLNPPGNATDKPERNN